MLDTQKKLYLCLLRCNLKGSFSLFNTSKLRKHYLFVKGKVFFSVSLMLVSHPVEPHETQGPFI